MVKILNCYLYAKKSYGTLSKSANFLGQPCILVISAYFETGAACIRCFLPDLTSHKKILYVQGQTRGDKI